MVSIFRLLTNTADRQRREGMKSSVVKTKIKNIQQRNERAYFHLFLFSL